MRKLLLTALIAATAIPGVASAQSRQEVREDRQDMRQDRREDLRDRRDDLRQDRRELRRDQRQWRNTNRTAYVSPYRDWRYRPVVTGYQLRPGFYGDRYAVNNWNRYQISQPRRNQRWVRYGDDLVLVNIRNGRVLQVIRNRY